MNAKFEQITYCRQMRTLKSLILLPVIVVQVLLADQAEAVDILNTAETVFFNPQDRTRLGIEIEFKGLGAYEAAEKIRSLLGGEIRRKEERIKTSIRSYDSSGHPIYNEVVLHEFEVVDSSIGNVLLKPETNQIDDISGKKLYDDKILYPNAKEKKPVVVELVTAPIRYAEVQKLDRALEEIKKSGARGTDAETAVSTQVNVEMFEGKRDKVNVQDVLNILRAYLRPEHSEQIEAHLDVPEIRKPYISEYSPGFMKKLLDPKYNPTERELYDDFVYRQSMEFLGESSAWTDPIKKVRSELLKKPNPVVPEVVKQNRLRVSSLLMWMFPDDYMSELYKDTGWAVARPLIEFREWNNEFNASSPSRQALGLKSSAEKYGFYDHDRLLSELSGIEAGAFPRLRKMVNRSRKTNEIVTFRYYLGSSDSLKNTASINNISAYGSEPVGYLDPKQEGIAPVIVPGESVVLHRDPAHAKSIIGKYNPNLFDSLVTDVLKNKYAEYRFFEDYAPGMMPKSELLSKLVGKKTSPEEVKEILNEKFPQGYLIEGVWGKEEPNTFEHPDQWIVREKLPVSRRFQVEVLGGKVISGGSTIEIAAKSSRAKILKMVEKYAQKLVDRLPSNLQGFPMSMEIALLDNGKFMLMSSNPGGNSASLYEERPESIHALTSYLREYLGKQKSGKNLVEMTHDEQINFLKDRLGAWGIDVSSHYPHLRFIKNRCETLFSIVNSPRPF